MEDSSGIIDSLAGEGIADLNIGLVDGIYKICKNVKVVVAEDIRNRQERLSSQPIKIIVGESPGDQFRREFQFIFLLIG